MCVADDDGDVRAAMPSASSMIARADAVSRTGHVVYVAGDVREVRPIEIGARYRVALRARDAYIIHMRQGCLIVCRSTAAAAAADFSAVDNET